MLVFFWIDDAFLEVGDGADAFGQTPVHTGLVGFPIQVVWVPGDGDLGQAAQPGCEGAGVPVGVDEAAVQLFDGDGREGFGAGWVEGLLDAGQLLGTDVELAGLKVGQGQGEGGRGGHRLWRSFTFQCIHLQVAAGLASVGGDGRVFLAFRFMGAQEVVFNYAGVPSILLESI